MVDTLMVPKKEQVRNRIKGIYNSHRYGDAMWANLTAHEAETAYRDLQWVIRNIDELTDEDKKELLAEVEDAISKIPEVEEEIKKQWEEEKAAFSAAKERYEKKSMFSKLAYAMKGKTPRYYEQRGIGSVEESNELYR